LKSKSLEKKTRPKALKTEENKKALKTEANNGGNAPKDEKEL